MVKAISHNVNGTSKKILAVIIILSFIVPLFSFVEGSALKIGDEIGNVLNTDIKTYIDGERIPSYNIGGRSAVLIKDLINYGFNSVYNDETRTSRVTHDPNKKKTPITSFEENTKKPGTVAFKYVYTDIIAYVNDKKVESFNIKGNLAIFFGDLRDYGTFVYNDVERVSRFTSNKSVLLQAENNDNQGSSGNNGESYVVKFNLNYFNSKNSIPDQNVKKGGYASRPTTADVKRSNYLLTAWYTDKDCKNEFSFDTPINANITLYAKWISYNDYDNSHKDYIQVEGALTKIEQKYLNSKGYVDYKDFDKVMEEIVAYVQNLYEQDKILEYKYTADIHTISFILKTGGICGFSPKNNEFLNSGGDIQIKTYEPFQEELNNNIREIYPNSIEYINSVAPPQIGQKYAMELRSNYSANSTTTNYFNNNVGIETLKKVSGDIVLWEGHGNWIDTSKYIGSILYTGVQVSETLDDSYKDDNDNGHIVKMRGYYAITSKFVDRYLSFEGSLIYLNTCYSLKTTGLAQAFVNKGASVVIGNKNEIDMLYARFLSENITKYLLEKTGNNYLYTVRQAIDRALSLNVSGDVQTSKEHNEVGTTCVPRDSNFRLSDLIKDNLQGNTGVKGIISGSYKLNNQEVEFPISNATVTLYDVKNHSIVAKGTSDINGYYIIECSEGTYDIEISTNSEPQYVKYEKGFVIRRGRIENFDICFIIGSSTNTPTGIEGTLVYSPEMFNHRADFPVVGAKVTLYDMSKHIVASAVTDNNGYYRIECPAGTYNIEFTVYTNPPRVYMYEEYVVIRKDRMELFDARFIMENDNTSTGTTGVQGKVFDKDTNRPLQGVTVTLYERDNSKNSYTTTTDVNGYYIINCPEGRYEMILTKSGYNMLAVSRLSYVLSGAYDNIVVIKKDNIATLGNIYLEAGTLDKPTGIKGIVLDIATHEVIKTVRLKITDMNKSGSGSIITFVGEDGMFMIGLSPSVYALEFTKSGYKTKEIYIEIKEGIEDLGIIYMEK